MEKNCCDYAVKDISQARMGRRLIEMTEDEMPGLMALKSEYGPKKPLKGARIMGSLHMTCETAVLIETLRELGGDIRWASSNIFSTNDAAAAAIAHTGIPVFAIKGESLADYWDFARRAFTWPDGEGPDLIVDDGGDGALFFHQGLAAEKESATLKELDNNDDERALAWAIERALAKDETFFSRAHQRLRGLSEETMAGVMRLLQRNREGKLLVPAYNVNDAVTKSKFDNIYGTRESLVDAIKRATDIMISGKRALVCGFGHVGKGVAEALAAHKARVFISEIDPICGLQALMAGYNLTTVEDVLPQVDIVVTATGNKDVITCDHLSKLKNKAIVCNIGHFDCEIQMNELQERAIEREEIKPQVTRYRLPTGCDVYVLAEGRLVNLGCANGHPSFAMSTSFCNQVLAQLKLWQQEHEIDVYELTKKDDEYVASLHLESLGGKLTQLTDTQAKYIGVSAEGPFKEPSYRY